MDRKDPTSKLVLEGPFSFGFHSGWSINDRNVLSAVWMRWPDLYQKGHPGPLFRVTIERIERSEEEVLSPVDHAYDVATGSEGEPW